jgi:hypothetical protein
MHAARPRRVLSTLSYQGGEIALEPLPRLDLPAKLQNRFDEQPSWLDELVHNHTYRNLPASAYARMLADAREAGELRVTILGSSTSNSCASCDYRAFRNEHVNHTALPEPGRSPRSEECDVLAQKHGSHCIIQHSWGRSLQDELNDNGLLPQMRGTAHALLGVRARVHVWAKNAVGPDHFSWCTDTFVADKPHLILLELATNLFGGSLGDLIRRLKRAAPRALIAVVMWVSQDAGDMREAIELVGQTTKAADTTTDVLRVDVIARKRLLFAIGGSRNLYALEGRDKVHPNGLAHALLALFTARFIITQPSRAAAETPPVSSTAARSTTAEEDDTPREDGGGEHCYGHTMPIVTSAGWSFVDLGKRKGVAKLGWESYKVGQTLTMGPLFNTSRRECGMLKMALGYHSSWDHELGALHISCGDGCTCILDQRLFAKVLTPFPRVETDAALAPDKSLRRNFSVTVPLPFFAFRNSSAPCTVSVKHLTRRESKRGAESRVRVDSLDVGGLWGSNSTVVKFLLGPHGRKPQFKDGRALAKLVTACG